MAIYVKVGPLLWDSRWWRLHLGTWLDNTVLNQHWVPLNHVLHVFRLCLSCHHQTGLGSVKSGWILQCERLTTDHRLRYLTCYWSAPLTPRNISWTPFLHTGTGTWDLEGVWLHGDPYFHLLIERRGGWLRKRCEPRWGRVLGAGRPLQELWKEKFHWVQSSSSLSVPKHRRCLVEDLSLMSLLSVSRQSLLWDH